MKQRRGCWRALLDGLLPPRCILCGAAVFSICLCEPCRQDLPWTGCHCRQCGLPLATAQTGVCGRCLQQPPPFAATISPLQYLFPVNRMVQDFKFKRQLAAGRVLAQLLCAWVDEHNCVLPDALIPVPLHTWRLYQRGFNQAWELGNHVSRTLGIPLLTGRLRRRRNTAAQSGLNRKQRRSNIRGAFHWHGGRNAPRHLAVIDDVMTTGTTASECARVLRRAGARRVDVWVAARAIIASREQGMVTHLSIHRPTPPSAHDRTTGH